MRSVATTVLRGLRAGTTCSSSSPASMAVRAFSTQETTTATLFPGDGGWELQGRRCAPSPSRRQ